MDMDHKDEDIVSQFRKNFDDEKIRRIPDDVAERIQVEVYELYKAFKQARDNWQPELYEMLMYDGNQRRPWEWLLAFLDDKTDIVAIPFRNTFDKTWFRPDNTITIEPDCSYWFANGADAHRHFGTRGALNNYFLSNMNQDWLIFYDDRSNSLFLYGDEAMQWANQVQDGFYDAVGLTYNDDVRLFNVSIEDWGYRLVLECHYQHAHSDDLDHYSTMVIIFDDCRYLDWSPSINLEGKPYDTHQRVWMYMGYRRKSGEMVVPAFLDSFALGIKFTYREMVVVKE